MYRLRIKSQFLGLELIGIWREMHSFMYFVLMKNWNQITRQVSSIVEMLNGRHKNGG